MKILSRNDQSGRSMVEMLGVLAIIGVLSVGGISGYSKAMGKFKLTKAQDQITMLLMNVRTAFASSPTYSGLNNEIARELNLAPSEMISAGASTSNTLINAFGGSATVGACTATICGVPEATAASYFYLQFNGLTREVCANLATADWGSDGLYAVGVATPATSDAADPTYAANGLYTSYAGQLPISVATAMSDCSGKSSSNGVMWVYY